MGTNANMINFDSDQTLFKVMQGESFTVPDTVTTTSPTGQSSGVSPVNTFGSKRPAVGGQIFAAFSDVAGPTSLELEQRIAPGDIVALTAVGGGKSTVSLNGVTILVITTTAVAGVIGVYA